MTERVAGPCVPATPSLAAGGFKLGEAETNARNASLVLHDPDMQLLELVYL